MHVVLIAKHSSPNDFVIFSKTQTPTVQWKWYCNAMWKPLNNAINVFAVLFALLLYDCIDKVLHIENRICLCSQIVLSIFDLKLRFSRFTSSLLRCTEQLLDLFACTVFNGDEGFFLFYYFISVSSIRMGFFLELNFN